MDQSLNIMLAEHGTPEYYSTIELRWRILRKPLGLHFTADKLAGEWQDFHVAAWRGLRLAGCLVLTPLTDGTLKMRQVAVDTDLQRTGIGQAMVLYSEQFARAGGYPLIVLNARQNAVPFYLGLGYQITGDPFTEVSIPHRAMFKDMTV